MLGDGCVAPSCTRQHGVAVNQLVIPAFKLRAEKMGSQEEDHSMSPVCEIASLKFLRCE